MYVLVCTSLLGGAAAIPPVEGAWRRSTASSRSICASVAGGRPGLKWSGFQFGFSPWAGDAMDGQRILSSAFDANRTRNAASRLERARCCC